jgi:ABC-type nitrate/sulfonate/bicarbonate transport system substrate-binding protein
MTMRFTSSVPVPRRARRLRRVAATSVLAASALALSACAADSSTEAPSSTGAADFGKLDYNQSWVKTTEFAGEYFADSKGYFKDAGFSQVNLISGGPSGTSSETMVLAGSALVGTTTPIATGSMVAESDAPLKIIGAKFQKNPFTVYSLAENPIKTPQDMVGKRIGVASGTNEILFEALLEVNGIDPSQVEAVPVQFDPQPLMNGEVDGQIGFLTNEAITVGLEGFDVVNMPFADNGMPFVAGAFVTTEENLTENRDALKAFMTAAIKGWKDALAAPDESARLAYEEYGADLGLDPAKEKKQAVAQNELVAAGGAEANGILYISDELAQANVEVLKVAGYDLTVDELFDNSLLEEVYAEHPELKEQ